MPGLPKDGTSKGKRTIARKRLPDELAQDPTSIFFAAVRYTQPEALAELARICQKQIKQKSEPVNLVKTELDSETVLHAMELLKSGQSAVPAIGEITDSQEFETAEYAALLPSGHHRDRSQIASTESVRGAAEPGAEFIELQTTEVVRQESFERDNGEAQNDSIEQEAPGSEAPGDDSIELEAPEVEAPGDDSIELEAPEVEAPDDDSIELEAPGSEAPEDDSIELEAPEVEAPGDDSIELEAPEVEAPEDDSIELEAPGSEAPGDDSIELEAPGSEAPGDDSIELEAPGSEAPEDDSIELEAPGSEAPEDDSIELEAPDAEFAPDTLSVPDSAPDLEFDRLQVEDFSPQSDSEPDLSHPAQPELTETAVCDASQQFDAASDSENPVLPGNKRAVKKAPLRIEAAPPKQEFKQIAQDAIESIPGAFDRGINEEFKGVYEKASQRGGVFDAQRRDAFSSESEKKVKSSYLGLKAISFDEALTVQQPEINPAILRSQSQNIIAPEPPPTFADKAQAVWAIVDRMHSTPVIISTSVICLAFLGFFVGNLCRAEGMMQDGEKLFAAGKYSEAIKVLTTSAELNPMRARTLFLRGRAFNKIGETGKAIDDFSRSVSINPRNEEPFDHRASSYIKANKFDLALADYRHIFELKPSDATLYRYDNAAFAARECGKFEEASRYYDRALQISPDDANALIGKVMCEVGLNRYGKAIEACERAISKKPNDLEPYVTRGWVYTLLKQNDAAMRDFDFVLAKDPKNAKAFLNRGVLHFNMGDLAAAVKDYSSAVAVDPKLLEARVARGWATINGNPKLSLSDFRAITRSSQYSSSAKCWKARAELEAVLGEKNAAAASYRKAIALASMTDANLLPSVYVGQASVLVALKKFDEAIESSNQALKLEPRNYLALTYRGLAHDSSGNGISAVADYSSAISIVPSAAEALWYRSQHYSKAGEFHSAQKDLTDYLNVRPGDKSAQKMLASVSSKTQHSSSVAETSLERRSKKYRAVPFEKLVATGLKELNAGNTETAAEMLQEAVRKNPSDVTARRYLCHALVREDPKASVVQFDILRTAISLPTDDERSYRHALSLAATGSVVEAAAIDKALKTVAEEPGNSQACYKLSTLYAAAGILSKAAQYCQSGMASAKSPAETKRFQDLYQRLNKQNTEGEHKEDIEG